MNQDIRNNADTTNLFDRFIGLASNIADGALGTRAGFGAFRNYQSLSDKSIRLAIDSGFFAPPREKSGKHGVRQR